MPTQTAIADYYQRYGHGVPTTSQVTAYRLEDVAAADSYPHVRRDFYKIKLLCGADGILSYADQRVGIKGCALIFVNPLIPYAWERTAGRETGFACLFTEEFGTPQLRTASVAQSPLFRVGGTPVLFPTPAAVARIKHLFEQLLAELPSPYPHKYEVLRSYVQLLLHESLRLLPTAPTPADAGARLQARFLDLLARQFPLASPYQPLALRTANEFARQLAVHPNHLNKVLKALTGHSTTAHIAGRLAEEAQALLQHSNWSVAEIAHGLGFGHASNFNAFFKKQTGQTPNGYRRQAASLS
ncbi:helix-turn-helix transcriptional regulator [Hymenobacter sp. ASUV-10]|uniref:Helix-turn-helix transcriptional regulator n=1 Tax=Hymenobacter aranciens TaxID=3063996 RepID=A0ABT9BEE6_9BACT|nr:helix-turn-helix transcriptional regulator [Hymenobacter sp. ASUV-10]MDO7876038.1 helix-turn-helix transcriptional regulator [Hymenobacter sp. ASUV-10]